MSAFRIAFAFDKAAALPVGQGYDARPPGAVTAITLHSDEHGAGQTFADVCAYGRDNRDVSWHYGVGPDGAIERILDPKWRAWHAGVSAWQGRPDCNDYSIGIELYHRAGAGAYPAVQLAALRWLCRQLLADHLTITPAGIHLHRWCALPPGRKADPTDLDDNFWRQWIAAL